MPESANAVKMRRLTPKTPTIDRPDTVINAVPLMLDIPLMGFSLSPVLALMTVPGLVGLNVLSTRIGMFFTQTG